MGVWIALVLLVALPAAAGAATEDAPGRVMARHTIMTNPRPLTTDHSMHKALQFDPGEQKAFTGPEVTAVCLSCHNQAAIQFHETIHWTWTDPYTEDGRKVGKGQLTVNNFCVALKSNEPRCTSCHAGYGWKNMGFDFSDPTKIDCLVCHEKTREYKKFPAGAGFTAPWIDDPENPGRQKGKLFPSNGKTYYQPDWAKVAQSVGKPDRVNCGTCHFNGGGGDGVKHGDLDSTLVKPDKQLDVHMGDPESGGQGFTCARCHTTKGHDIAGRIYSTPAMLERKSLVEDDLHPKIMCESCHTAAPHKQNQKANDHTDKVACQSCHIPSFARIKATKMSWDWSKAGDRNREPQEIPGTGHTDYDPKKGEFVWAKNVRPEYHWYNGSMTTMTAEDVIDPSHEVRQQWPVGGLSDPSSRIMPFKVHRGMTPYDSVNKTMAVPHLFPTSKDDDSAYWKHYDWAKALKAGMDYAGVPYSGEYGFVATAFAYPTTHMVAPKENAVQCAECHARQGRLANLAGFYMPGRDTVSAVDWLGWAGVGLAVAGVLLHGLLRMFSATRKEG
jgi:octaheme c-type cytochrome (tetrathionate reductase family)